MAKVSIIVPVYNVEKYICKCLESIVNQTLQELEIILVDDGSTDKSGEICEEYRAKDSRIQVIHKSNGGLSDARNEGVKYVSAEYIIFIDSDDYISENMIEILYNLAEENDADMSVCGVCNIYGEKEIPQYELEEEFLCTGREAFRHILEGKRIPGTICNKLIKRGIARQLQFPTGKLYEDAFYTLDLIQKVERVYVTTRPMYYYIHRCGSITTSKFKKADLDILRAYQKTLELVKEKYPELKMQAVFRLLWAHFVVVDRILELDNYKKNSYFGPSKRFLKKNIAHILRNPYFTKKRRMAAVLFFVNIKLYRKVLLRSSKQLSGA